MSQRPHTAQTPSKSLKRQLRRQIIGSLLILSLSLIACKEQPAANESLGVTVVPENVSGTPAVAASPSPIASPGAALTPRAGAKADLATAKRLESEGDFENAAQGYIATAAAGGANRSEATLSAARVLLELERPADVRILLEPYVATATGRDNIAHYLLARAYAALNLWAPSLEQYDAYIASSRAALPYAYLDRANILVQLDRPLAAVTSVQDGLALGVPLSTRRAFLAAIAQDYERAGSFANAIVAYNALIVGSGSASDKALGLSRIAAIKRTQGDPTYTTELRRLLSDYPATSQALLELTDALNRGETIDPVVRGIVYYKQNDYTKAELALKEQIALSPNALATAEAYYYEGAILESKDDPETARTTYARVVVTNPQSTVADDALWWQARILEDAGKSDDARALYARITTEYPNSTWAPDAAFRRGMLAYNAGKYADAASIWSDSLIGAAADQKQRLDFWRAKALLKANSKDAAKPLLDGLTVQNEDDYYGVRALALTKNENGTPKSKPESKVDLAPSFDWAQAETWLALKAGRPVVNSGWSTDNRWLRAEELWTIGRTSQGDGEAFDLIEAYARDPIAMYTMSRQLWNEGRYGMSGRAGQRLLRVLDTNPNAGLPKAILSLSYPPAFGTYAKKYADAEKISPLLLMAFVRQESFFDPRAESPVAAYGLTQLLPTTAKSLATRMGLAAPDIEDLYAADLNLRFGASYMADQLKSFDNEVFVAFAAYNAGPNAAKRWRKQAGSDPDAFLETIEFAESRLYVELVAENYAIYRFLYGGSAVPDLPY